MRHIMSSGQCQSKQQLDTTAHLPEWPKSKTLTTPNANKGCEAKRTPLPCWGCKVVQSCWNVTVCHFLTKLQTLLSYDPAIVVLGIYPDELKICSHKPCTQVSIQNRPNLQATATSFRRRIDK